MKNKPINEFRFFFLLAVFLLVRDIVGIISWMKQDWDRMVVNNLIHYPIFLCGGLSSLLKPWVYKNLRKDIIRALDFSTTTIQLLWILFAWFLVLKQNLNKDNPSLMGSHVYGVQTAFTQFGSSYLSQLSIL